jgi:hypothetical protein
LIGSYQATIELKPPGRASYEPTDRDLLFLFFWNFSVSRKVTGTDDFEIAFGFTDLKNGRIKGKQLDQCLAQPTDRGVRDVVRPGNVREHFTSLPTRNRLSTLMASQLRSTPHDDATSYCTLTPLPGAAPDQVALKLSQAAQDGQHEASVRGRGVSPGIPQRFEPSALVSNSAEDIQEIPRRSSQPIKACHHQHIALVQRRYKPGELLAVGSGTADLLLVNPLAIGGFEFGHLRRQRLAIGAYAGIPK